MCRVRSADLGQLNLGDPVKGGETSITVGNPQLRCYETIIFLERELTGARKLLSHNHWRCIDGVLRHPMNALGKLKTKNPVSQPFEFNDLIATDISKHPALNTSISGRGKPRQQQNSKQIKLRQ